ncbi:MAG TPA: type II secretion system F family protein, partial [Chloroflexota bacterium]|nr:type II secretion system F family protein [Chloroflexota bacterium]
LVSTAEVSGDLDRTLSLAAEYLETTLEMQRKVRGAMTYPVILFLVAVGVIVFMLTYLLPQFRELFTKMNAVIPTETRVMFALSDFLVGRWYVVVAAIAIAIFSVRAFASTREGSYQICRLLQSIPVLGDLRTKIAISRQIRSLGTLMESGVGLLVALTTAAPTAQNVLFEEAMMSAWHRVNEGATLNESMRESGRFPSMVCQMVAVGEKSGRVGSILLRMAAYYEREVDARLKTLSTVLEPLMIVFLGVVVGFLAVSIISPIYSLVSSVK